MSGSFTSVLRGWAHRRVRRAWQHRGLLARLLYPLHLAHAAWRGVRAAAYALGAAAPVRLPVPVIVVGNLSVGGTGKTPLVVAIARALQARGWSPGVVARGYGANLRHAVMVEANSDVAQCGDEPLLVRQLAGVPVAVGRDRAAAARLLLSTHTGCNLIIADDGLQHRRLGRDVEVAVINATSLGNGWLLPAGPLRDPPQRLRTVDAVVLHGAVPCVRVYSPFYRMRSDIHEAFCLADPARRVTLERLAQEQREGGLRVLALCAIGTPERFFSQLREHGLHFDARGLPDHDAIDPRMLPPGGYDRVLITEKDAVKCRRDAHLRQDERIWVVPLDVQLDGGLVDLLAHKLEETTHGSKAA